jgi:hypothetical protein
MADERRTALIHLGGPTLARLLDLPEGLQVIAIQAQFDPAGFVLKVEGDSLQPVPSGAESPVIGGYFGRTQVVVDDAVYSRFTWKTGDPR